MFTNKGTFCGKIMARIHVDFFKEGIFFLNKGISEWNIIILDILHLFSARSTLVFKKVVMHTQPTVFFSPQFLHFVQSSSSDNWEN